MSPAAVAAARARSERTDTQLREHTAAQDEDLVNALRGVPPVKTRPVDPDVNEAARIARRLHRAEGAALISALRAAAEAMLERVTDRSVTQLKPEEVDAAAKRIRKAEERLKDESAKEPILPNRLARARTLLPHSQRHRNTT